MNSAFHFRMALLLAGFLSATALTGAVTGVHVEHPGLLLLAVVTVAAALSPIPAYAHQTGRIHYRESSLALLWALAFAVLLPLSVRSLAMFNLPLQDSHFAFLDHAFGVSVPKVVLWAGRDEIGRLLTSSYGFLVPWLAISTFAVGYQANGFVRASLSLQTL